MKLSEAKHHLPQSMPRGEMRTAGGRRFEPRLAGTDSPLSNEQRQVWPNAMLAPAHRLYNEPVTIYRHGALDIEVLERSFNEVLRRHEIWRTSFHVRGNKVVQVAHPDLRIHLRLVDLTALPNAQRLAEAHRLATEDVRQPFDLAEPPLLRAKVVRLAEDDHRILLTLHHLVFDCASLRRVVLPELAAIYAAFAAGQASPLPEPSLQYGDYAVFQATEDGGAMARKVEYWRGELAGASAMLRLPTDRPRPVAPGFDSATERFSLPANLISTLKEFGRTEATTLHTVLLAGFTALLHRYTGQDDIVIGGVVDTRRHVETQALVGCFVNAFALRTSLATTMSFRQHLLRIRDKLLAVLRASEAPLDRVSEKLWPQHEPGVPSPFKVQFSFQPPAARVGKDWSLRQRDIPVAATKFDLSLEIEEEEAGGFSCCLIYRTDLYDAGTIRRFADHWIRLLEGVAFEPACPVKQLPSLAAIDARRVLGAGVGPVEAIPDLAAYERSERQARSTADDERERKLVAIWKDVLGIDTIGVCDDFFDLGGQSLQLVRLLARVEAEFGRKLSAASVFGAPDIRRMAALLADTGAPADLSSITTIHPLGSHPNLYWLNAGPAIRPLAQALGPDQPFTIVDVDAALACAGDPPSLRAIAEPLAQAIRDAQPHGPYYLAGYCASGLLAYEVAVQLAVEGVTPTLLVLLDAFNPALYHKADSPIIVAAKVGYHLGQLCRLRGAQRRAYLLERLQSQRDRLAALMPSSAAPVASRNILREAALAYAPPAYAGDVALFQGKRPKVLDFRAGWAKVVTGSLTVHDVSGPHSIMLEVSHIHELAEALSARLRRPAQHAEGVIDGRLDFLRAVKRSTDC